MSRKLVATVCGFVAVACLVAFFIVRGDEMAKARATVAALCKDAETAIAAKDWDKAETCLNSLKTKKPDGEQHACRLRGQMFQVQGRLAEAQIEYTKAYALGDHVAGGSAAKIAKRLAKGGN